jgi:hypothetical protein
MAFVSASNNQAGIINPKDMPRRKGELKAGEVKRRSMACQHQEVAQINTAAAAGIYILLSHLPNHAVFFIKTKLNPCCTN